MKINYQIENFKAFSDSGKVDFKPITVLCGVNSAGKSSIIKSILLAKQSAAVRRSALSSSIPPRPLILNGEFTQLGSWSDTITARDRSRTMKLSWGVEAEGREFQRSLMRANIRSNNQKSKRDQKKRKVDLSVSLSSDPDVAEELSARVDAWKLTIDGATIHLQRNDSPAALNEETYRVEIDNLHALLAREGAQIGRYALYLGDTVKAVAAHKGKVILGNVAVTTAGPFVSGMRAQMDETWSDFFDSVYSMAGNYRGIKRGPLPKWMGHLQNATRNYRKSAENKSIDISRSPAIRSLIFLAYELVEEVVRAHAEAKAVIAPMWRDIRYLGPLRDQPRRYYQFDDTGGTDVGVSGEFTVQVLALEKSRELTARRLSKVDSEGVTYSGEIRSSLLDHTNHWLDVMGLPSVSPSSLEQSLYKLEVGDLGVGLLDVGFGVSQVLPIIVEALRAEAGDQVVLEQPEIHLHPRVQAQLADFLVARSKDGVRFLIESHSEYLIKRLCRRLAESRDGDMDGLINIVFVEGEPGEATCKQVKVNSFGEIEDWPAGFFDLDEDLYWAKASLKKRRLRAKI